MGAAAYDNMRSIYTFVTWAWQPGAFAVPMVQKCRAALRYKHTLGKPPVGSSSSTLVLVQQCGGVNQQQHSTICIIRSRLQAL